MSVFGLDKMNKKVIPDPFTGGEQTIFWNNEGTFFMAIPHQATPLPFAYVSEKIEWADNPDGSKTWEIKPQ